MFSPSVKCVAETTDLMESVEENILLITENINKIVTKPVNIFLLTVTEPTVFADLKVCVCVPSLIHFLI